MEANYTLASGSRPSPPAVAEANIPVTSPSFTDLYNRLSVTTNGVTVL